MKTLSAHTPGPWTIRDGVFIDAPGLKNLAALRGIGASEGVFNPDPEIVANAKLIAAAPELLELLTLALPYIEEGEAFNKPNGPKLSARVRKQIETL